MKITDVEIIQALHWPFVRIHTDAGISGIGEASLQQKELAVRTEEAYRDYLICYAGGIFELRKIAAMAETCYVMVAPHNSNGPISTVASIHLDACMPNAVLQELVVNRIPIYNELLTEPLVVQDGYFQVPDGPGWGVDIVEAAEERYPAQMLPAIEERARYYYE